MNDELREVVRQVRRDLDQFHATTGERLSRILRALEGIDAPAATHECPRCNLDFPTAEKRDDHLSNVHGEGW